MKNSVYAVIMAGGMGERFWPKSRKKSPKQLLSITSKNTMIQETVKRLRGIVQNEKILIITNKVQAPLIKKQLPGINKKNIIAEPLSKNTAPAIALAASIIKKRDGDNSIMIVLPSDHIIKDISKFKKTIKDSIGIAAKNEVLVTLGIKPSAPHTGYGYIKKGKILKNRFYKISRFTEKPDLKTAKKYVKSREYFWNSGMFIWRVDTVLDEIKKYVPKIINNLNRYNKVPSVSIDYGVMEKTKKAVVAEALFSWDDVGNWAALEGNLSKDRFNNITKGNAVVLDTKGSIVITDSHLVATLGIKDLIIVAAKDAVLICPKDRAQEVKKIVGVLRKRYKQYL